MSAAALIAKLDALSNPSALSELSQILAKRTLGLIDKTFRARQDPYQSPWAALKHPPSKATGAMRTGWGVRRADSRGFTVANSQFYAIYQNDGTRFMNARPQVPRFRLPEAWAAEFATATTAWLNKRLRGI